MNLRECEKLFTDALRPTSSDGTFLQACDMLVEHGSLPVQQRLLIYRHNISGGYINALASTYVVCEQILGKSCFASFARDYAWNRTHQSGNLNELGKDFPDYLESEISKRKALTDFVYLADMARLEWLVERSMRAGDEEHENIIDASLLANYDPERVYPVVSCSLQLLATEYPVFELWQAHRDSTDTSSVLALDEHAYLCICRDEYDDVIIQNLSDELFYFLLGASQGDSLYSLASRAPSETMQLLQKAMQYGWLTGFKV